MLGASTIKSIYAKVVEVQGGGFRRENKRKLPHTFFRPADRSNLIRAIISATGCLPLFLQLLRQQLRFQETVWPSLLSNNRNCYCFTLYGALATISELCLTDFVQTEKTLQHQILHISHFIPDL